MKANLNIFLVLAALLGGCGQKSSQTPPVPTPSATVTDAAPLISAVELTLTRDERILFQGRAVPVEKLAATLRAAGVPPAKVSLLADSKVSFSFVLRVMDAIRVTSGSMLLAS
jgi:biopolymer transport protein ExbD